MILLKAPHLAVHVHRRRIHPAQLKADELHRALLSKPAKPKLSTASAWPLEGSAHTLAHQISLL